VRSRTRVRAGPCPRGRRRTDPRSLGLSSRPLSRKKAFGEGPVPLARRLAGSVLNLPFQGWPLPLKQRVNEWQLFSSPRVRFPVTLHEFTTRIVIICGFATLGVRGVFGPDRPVRGGLSLPVGRPPGQVPARQPGRWRISGSARPSPSAARSDSQNGSKWPKPSPATRWRSSGGTFVLRDHAAAAARRGKAEGPAHGSPWRRAGSAGRLITAGPAN